MAAKKRRKKTGKKRASKRPAKKRSSKKRARKTSGGKKKARHRRAKKSPKGLTIIPLGTLGDIRAKAKRTGQSVGDIILEAMKKGAPRGNSKKRDISKVVAAQLLLPR